LKLFAEGVSIVSTFALPAANLAVNESVAHRDTELVELAKEGDKQAFFGLFELHKKGIYSLSLRLTGNIPEAEDLTRQIFLNGFRKLHDVHDDAQFSSFLYRDVAISTFLQQHSSQEISTAEYCHEHYCDQQRMSNSWEAAGPPEHLRRERIKEDN